ncbi:MAG: hypothetical protein KIS94_10215 [Chitinophagales bacterium]|nr:hypothetical protein [Chitinophagales bacterium]
MTFRLTAILLLLLCVTKTNAQRDTVTLKLYVFDSYTQKALSGVSIINPNSSATNATDANGLANLKINKTDTLFLFYPGYRTTKFMITDTVARAEYSLNISIEPLTTGLNQAVIIKAPKTLEQIEDERKRLGLTPKELDRPIIQPFTSPISALYEILSSRAQEREKLKKQIKEDDRRRIFKELLHYYNENELIDLPEAYYDDFIDFCNLPLEFLKYSSDYEITKTVIDNYKKYSRLSGIQK